MLSVFPILFLSLLAHTILRLFVGGTLFYLGIRHLGTERVGLTLTLREHWPKLAGFTVWYLGLLELVLGALIFIGAWTQPAALLAAILALKMIVFGKRFGHPSIPQKMTWVLLLGACLSLTITGAGAFGFDLPL